MTERPILFSGPMVRAILAGTKTQTRRVVKPQPQRINAAEFEWKRWLCAMNWLEKQSPYGVPGDTLWVREMFCYAQSYYYAADFSAAELAAERRAVKLAPSLAKEHRAARWRPSIHMPRAACRLLLRVTAVRCDRLQDIGEADCRAEGALSDSVLEPAVVAFRRLWDSINAERAPWSSNPWVWVVSFERLE